MLGDEASIGMGVKRAVPVFPDTADAEFSLGNDTVVIAKKTVNFFLFQFFIKECFFGHGFSFRVK
jgi:hypothetical protein